MISGADLFVGLRPRLVFDAAGLTVSTARFTYAAPASGSFTNTLTTASSGFTSATATASAASAPASSPRERISGFR